MRNWRLNLIASGMILVFIALSYSVFKKEQLLDNGDQVFLKLAPVDPRSLIQGDYMILNYYVPAKLREVIVDEIEGDLVYIKNKNNVAELMRLYNVNEALQENENRIHFRKSRLRIALGANSFFFQEGKAEQFSSAKFGEVSVDNNGESVLVGLRDENYKLLGLSSGFSSKTDDKTSN